MRATTMYFGAALHTQRGGQCPSLLRPKEGAGEYGRGERGAWRSGRGTEGKHGAEKMNKLSERPEKGRAVFLRHVSPPFLRFALTCVSIDEPRFALDPYRPGESPVPTSPFLLAVRIIESV